MRLYQLIKFKNDINGNNNDIIAVYKRSGDSPRYAITEGYYRLNGASIYDAVKKLGLEMSVELPTIYTYHGISKYKNVLKNLY